MTWVSVNSCSPGRPSSRPMPLALNPPKGARSSAAVALWLLKKVTPVRSCLPIVMACSVSADQTEEHRPDQVWLARATASASLS